MTDPAPTPALNTASEEFELGADSVFFQGHFPGDPIFPAVAQLAEVVLPAVARAWPDLPPVRGFRNVKFLKVLRPGATCRLTLTRRGEGVAFEITSGTRVCAGLVVVG